MLKRICVCSVFIMMFGLGVMSASGSESSKRESEEFESTVKPFLTTYCLDCHGPDAQSGDRRFDELSFPLKNDDQLIDLQEMLDILNLGEMPPKEEAQPTPAERQHAVQWLTKKLEQEYATRNSTNRETVLRRMNLREYRHTLRDLLAINFDCYHPTSSFPRDQLVEHLDNVGDQLVTSGYLLNQYLAVADEVIEKTFVLSERPAVQTWEFHDNFQQQPELDGAFEKMHQFSYLTLYENPNTDKHEGAYASIHEYQKGVPVDGVYEITFSATALNRRHVLPGKVVSTDPTEQLRLGIVPGRRSVSELHLPQPGDKNLVEFALPDDQTETLTVRVWLDQGLSPRFVFLNGMNEVRGTYGYFLKNPLPTMTYRKDEFSDKRFNALQHGNLPQIRVDDITIRGPLYEQWPPEGQRLILGDKPFDETQMREYFLRFAERAYRRPADSDEVDRLMKLVDSQTQQGVSSFQAFKNGLKAVLCSPSFIYLHEPTIAGERLDDYALASRLSYFLWATMPDQELLTVAQNGTLSRPEVLRSQVRRMLADHRSDDFLRGFLESWLTLRDLGSQPPDRSAFEEYYGRNLKDDMLQETFLFARCLLDENLTIANFLDSEFTFLNHDLAELYGIEDDSLNHVFRKVTLNDRQRGGILGQASVLTVTANGIDTSPVIRGVWILETILGTPPSPPPPDVEPLNPDTRGATSIREQLVKHRKDATCYECHRKMDPLGFALETFDPIGRHRTRYSERTPIDPSGELPDGSRFKNLEEFKAILLTRQSQFARALTSKLLAYATGRRLEPLDRPHVDHIVEQLAKKGDGFADLVMLVTESEIFLTK